MSYVRGYIKTESGTLKIVDLEKYKGGIYHGVFGELSPAGEVVNLSGWPDRKAEIYNDELGNKIMVASNDAQ